MWKNQILPIKERVKKEREASNIGRMFCRMEYDILNCKMDQLISIKIKKETNILSSKLRNNNVLTTEENRIFIL